MTYSTQSLFWSLPRIKISFFLFSIRADELISAPKIFFTTSLSLLKSIETYTNLSTSNLSTLLFKLLKLVGIFLNLSISNLSTSTLSQSTFLANFHVSTPVAFFKSAFLA